MKIFSYISSPRGRNSSTYKIANKIINELQNKISEDFTINMYTGKSLNINCCTGCLNCFINGSCILDKKDNFNTIKEELITSDLIIIGSPVYACMVNGNMKIFIDRISYLLHLMPLINKPTIIITTSSNSGLKESNLYLKNIFEILGANIISNIPIANINLESLIETDEFYNNILLKTVDATILTLQNKKPFIPSKLQETYFYSCKNTYTINSSLDTSELRYWKDSELINCNTLTDAISLTNSNPNLLYSLIKVNGL
ncbi:flavodoxin family protein [Clostridium paraputrificum]|uniref:flavodoxin family protein n=1 Tax=Clostridium paraputrificum TaxID=29363 RepID=UPI003D35916B